MDHSCSKSSGKKESSSKGVQHNFDARPCQLTSARRKAVANRSPMCFILANAQHKSCRLMSGSSHLSTLHHEPEHCYTHTLNTFGSKGQRNNFVRSAKMEGQVKSVKLMRFSINQALSNFYWPKKFYRTV